MIYRDARYLTDRAPFRDGAATKNWQIDVQIFVHWMNGTVISPYWVITRLTIRIQTRVSSFVIILYQAVNARKRIINNKQPRRWGRGGRLGNRMKKKTKTTNEGNTREEGNLNAETKRLLKFSMTMTFSGRNFDRRLNKNNIESLKPDIKYV